MDNLATDNPFEESQHLTTLLGHPASYFTKDEAKFVQDEMRRFIGLAEKSPANSVFVDELIRAELELRRHDVKTMRALRRKKRTADELAKFREKDEKVRASFLKRFTNACEALGVMPKDIVAEDARDMSLSEAHQKYINIVKQMKVNGDEVGEVSKDARKLAEQRGVEWEHYNSHGTLPASTRNAVIKEYEQAKEGHAV